MKCHDAAGAASVVACEWNPNALQALRRNLELNGVADRCQVVEGDSRLTAPRVILRKNLFRLSAVLLADLAPTRGGILTAVSGLSFWITHCVR